MTWYCTIWTNTFATGLSVDSQKSRSSRDASSVLTGLALLVLLPARKSSNIGSDEVSGTPTYSEVTCTLLDELISINDSNPPPAPALVAAIQVEQEMIAILYNILYWTKIFVIVLYAYQCIVECTNTWELHSKVDNLQWIMWGPVTHGIHTFCFTER